MGNMHEGIMPLMVRSHAVQGVQVLSCSGRFVLGPELEVFEHKSQEALRKSSQLVVDLSGVRLLDDHGIGALTGLLVRTRRDGGDVRLVMRPDNNVVSRVLRLTRMVDVFRVFSNDMDAVGSYVEMFTRAIAV